MAVVVEGREIAICEWGDNFRIPRHPRGGSAFLIMVGRVPKRSAAARLRDRAKGDVAATSCRTNVSHSESPLRCMTHAFEIADCIMHAIVRNEGVMVTSI